jgi:hypothetical protein
MAEKEQNAKTVFLVNTTYNPDALIDKTSFTAPWKWVEAPLEWKSESGIPVEQEGSIDVIIVFARKYAEPEALAICQSIRSCKEWERIPLLVAISMFQMPLGNDVKRLPNASALFMPIKEEDLLKRLEELAKLKGHTN